MVPLSVKAIINLSKEGNHSGSDIGRGVAMAIGVFLLTITTSICQHQVRRPLIYSMSINGDSVFLAPDVDRSSSEGGTYQLHLSSRRFSPSESKDSPE